MQAIYDQTTNIWSLLQACPSSAWPWCALAWRAGVEDGRREVYAELGEAGIDVARAARPILARPSFADLQARRGEA